MSSAKELRELAQSVQDLGMCLCAVGPQDGSGRDLCPTCQKAADLLAEADAVDAAEAA